MRQASSHRNMGRTIRECKNVVSVQKNEYLFKCFIFDVVISETDEIKEQEMRIRINAGH